VRKAICVLGVAVLWLCPHPRLRARLLGLFGADVGDGARVHRGLLLNAEHGFSRLRIGAGVYVGPGVTLDLCGSLSLGARTTVSTGAILLTHTDAGSSHRNAVLDAFPPSTDGIVIGEDCWIGAGALVLDGCSLGSRCVVGAGAVVTKPLSGSAVFGGVPARFLRAL